MAGYTRLWGEVCRPGQLQGSSKISARVDTEVRSYRGGCNVAYYCVCWAVVSVQTYGHTQHPVYHSLRLPVPPACLLPAWLRCDLPTWDSPAGLLRQRQMDTQGESCAQHWPPSTDSSYWPPPSPWLVVIWRSHLSVPEAYHFYHDLTYTSNQP